MKLKIGISILAIVIFALFVNAKKSSDDRFLTYIVDPKKQDLKLFRKMKMDKILRASKI